MASRFAFGAAADGEAVWARVEAGNEMTAAATSVISFMGAPEVCCSNRLFMWTEFEGREGTARSASREV